MRRHEFYCEEHPFVNNTGWWHNYLMYYVLDSLEEIGFTVDDIHFSTASYKENGYEISIAFKEFSYIMEVKLPNGGRYQLGFAMSQNNGIIVEPNSIVYVQFITKFSNDALHSIQRSCAFKQYYTDDLFAFYFEDFKSYLCKTYFMKNISFFNDIAYALAPLSTNLADTKYMSNQACFIDCSEYDYKPEYFHYYQFKWHEGETTNYSLETNLFN